MENGSPTDWSSGPDRASREAWLEVVLRHMPRLDGADLDAAYEAEHDAIDFADQEVPHPAGSLMFQKRMVEIDDRLRRLVSDHAYALHSERCALGMSAQLLHGDEQLALGMILGAAWQYRAVCLSLYEWQVAKPVPALVAVRFGVDHRAAVAAAREAAYDDDDVRELIERERTPDEPGAPEGVTE